MALVNKSVRLGASLCTPGTAPEAERERAFLKGDLSQEQPRMDVERYARLNTGCSLSKQTRDPSRSESIPMAELPPAKAWNVVVDMPWDLATLPMVYQNTLENPAKAGQSITAEPLIPHPQVKTATTLQKTIAGEIQELSDTLWSRLTWSIKQKLRGACSEVLRRTDDPTREEQICHKWDEDAQLLD